MNFLLNEHSLYKEATGDYVIKNGKLYLKCTDWIKLENKTIRSATIIRHMKKQEIYEVDLSYEEV